MDKHKQNDDKNLNKTPLKNPGDPRKNPKPGYDEKNPGSKKDIQDHPEDQNTG